jgi:CBS domain-containing protein
MDTSITVRDVMSREFVGVSESDTVKGAVSVMLEDGADCAVVMRGSEPIGSLTSVEALSLLVDGVDPAETPVDEVMGPPAPVVAPRDAASEAVRRMVTEPARRLFVVDGTELVGVVTERDVLAATATSVPETPDNDLTVEAESRDPEYSDQSICEVCGTLARELANVNGQLVCQDCREM